MHRVGIVILLLCAMLALATGAAAEKPEGHNTNTCATIKDGSIQVSEGDPPSLETITMGVDRWGYNYQAHTFRGEYCDVVRHDYTPEWCGDMVGVQLVMEWNDTWKSNKDCTGDNRLDSHYGLKNTWAPARG